MTVRAVILFLAVATPAVADSRVPHSLHMRVAQAAPDAGVDDAPPDAAPPEPPPPPEAPPAPPPPVAAKPNTDDGKTEVISITDSSAEHNLIIGRAPVSVVTRADLAAAGRATLGDILQGNPAQSNGANAQVNAGGDGATRINLRGLGAPRTLVLVNGRRMVSGGNGADAAVDINAIPLAMIERVEILKDGSSTIYGADAVGGVVNIVTRQQFPGADVTALASTSQHGDGTEYNASAVAGFTTLDAHTYAVLSVDYQRHEAVLAGDRGFSRYPRSYDFASRTETRNLSLASPSGRLDASSIGAGQHVMGCVSDICKPDGAGGWTDFGAADEYNDAARDYLYTPSDRFTLFGTGGNRINRYAAAFVEVLYQWRGSDRQLSPVAFVGDTPISKDSIYNPFGADVLDYRRRIPELSDRKYSDAVRTFRLVAGIDGELWGWKYEVSTNYGDVDSRETRTGQLLKHRLADALGPSMINKNGDPICVKRAGDETSAITYRYDQPDGHTVFIPCVPLNLFSSTIPIEQLQNLTYTDGSMGGDSQRGLLAKASGTLAKLPHHGELALSVGYEVRSELGHQAPPPGASIADDYSTDVVTKYTDGKYDLTEGYGDLSIVPITGHPIARRVELDLGARALYHTKFGSHLAYKVGGLVRTVGGLAVRGTYATAFRAPAIHDLFGGAFERLPTAEDPCDTKPPSAGDGTKPLDPVVQDQCTAQGVPVGSKFTTSQQLSLSGGNVDLKPETAASVTAGVVLEPPVVPGLLLTADYWRISIANAIETLNIGTIFASCYEHGDQAFCDEIHRDPMTHRIAPVDQVLQNVHRTTTSGIDLGLWYDTNLGELGRLHSGIEAQYLLAYDLDTGHQVVHGVGVYDLGVYPRYKANLSARWNHPGGASAGFLLRFVGTYQECAANDCNDHAATARDVGRYFKLDLFGGYDMGTLFGRTAIQVGVNNILDATPPTVYNAAAASSDAATYDFIGRMIYVRIAQQF